MQTPIVKTIADKICDELTYAADEAAALLEKIGEADRYRTTDDWVESCKGVADELISCLDLLVVLCAEARDGLDRAMRGVHDEAQA